MSFPNIPNVTPSITINRKEAVHLLLSSIAFEELGLAHLINAEAEKIQKSIKLACSLEQLLEMNKSVEKMLQSIIMKEMLLQFKLNSILEIPMNHHDHDKFDEDVFDEGPFFNLQGGIMESLNEELNMEESKEDEPENEDE